MQAADSHDQCSDLHIFRFGWGGGGSGADCRTASHWCVPWTGLGLPELGVVLKTNSGTL